MSVLSKIFIWCILIKVLLISVPATGQILRDPASLKLIKEGIDNLYNLQFNTTREICLKLKQTYPGSPDISLLEGMIIYWENFPLVPTSPQRVTYESDLRKCIELSEEKHDPRDEAEYLLSNLSARGMLLLFYTDNDMNKDAFPLVISTYKYIRRSFDFTSSYSDFYFFTGLYNYYREAYPEAYPAYKAIAFLFPRGDKVKGMDELHIASRNSILFKAESSSFLSQICLSFENNSEQAFEHSKYLHELYPENIQYLSQFITNLLLLKQYDAAEDHVKYLSTLRCNAYFKAKLSILNGIIQEKKYHNTKVAEQFYLNGISALSSFGYFGNEFAAFGYFGLGRISLLRGDTDSGKTYRRKALELAEFEKVDFN